MIIKMKSYYLKKDISPEELVKYGFEKCGDNYSKKVDGLARDIRYYHDTRRIVYVDYPWKDGRSRVVKKHIEHLINDCLVELKINYEWWAIIGNWHYYSQKKKDRIQAKLDKLNKEVLK